jgi:large subunit ribosomal protein L32e
MARKSSGKGRKTKKSEIEAETRDVESSEGVSKSEETQVEPVEELETKPEEESTEQEPEMPSEEGEVESEVQEELEQEKTELKTPTLDPEIKRLMKVRIRQKSRKPEFKRYESHKKLRLRDKSWRRPRGMDNKMRKRIAGKKPVSVGFGTPSAVRNLHPSGFREILVRNPSELDGINAEKEAIRIASTVGLRKRLAIEDKARELGIRILNPQR